MTTVPVIDVRLDFTRLRAALSDSIILWEMVMHRPTLNLPPEIKTSSLALAHVVNSLAS